MRFLSKLFKVLLLLLGSAVVLALLTLLSWWMAWPLATGAVILLGLLGFFLLVLALRALYRRQDKRRFVRKVLTEEERLKSKDPIAMGRLSEVWRQGMEILRQSPLRFQKRMQYSQPWFVTLDVTGSSSPLFNALGSALPQDTSPLYWHFLSSSVVLRCPDTESTQGDWEELLTKLAQNQRHIPLRGIILLLSATSIESGTDETLTTLGRHLRARVQQVMLALNRRYPVYVILQGLEDLHGMPEVLDMVLLEDSDMILGATSNDTEEDLGRCAAENAAQRLENVLRMAAVEGRPPQGDMLCAITTLRSLGAKLQLVIGQIAREIAHQTRPMLCGVYFCQTERVEQRPGFLAGIFSRILPAANLPARLSGGLPFLASTRLTLMTAWLIIMLCICGLMGINVVYQHHILTLDYAVTSQITHDGGMDALYRQMNYAQELEKARSAWYLPTFGQDMLSIVEKQVKNDFILKVHRDILSPMLRGYHVSLSRRTADVDRGTTIDAVREMLWLCAVVSDRLEKKKQIGEHLPDFPLSYRNQHQWDPATGQLLISTISWISGEKQLASLLQEMRGLLTSNFARAGDILLNEYLEVVKHYIPAASVCRSDFWSNIAPSGQTDMCIPSEYTAAGYRLINETHEDIKAIVGNDPVMKQQLDAFRDSYFKRYAELWFNFIYSFSQSNTLQTSDTFISYADDDTVSDIPHIRLLEKLTTELAPLLEIKNSPSWVTDCLLLQTVSAIAMKAHRHEQESHWRTLLLAAVNAPELFQRLRDLTKSTDQLRKLLFASKKIHQYFDAILALLPYLNSPGKALGMAATHFAAESGTPVSTEEDKEDLYTTAEKSLANAVQLLAFAQHGPAADLLPDMLRFIAQGVTVQASKQVQKQWENDIMSSPIVLYRQDNVEGLFGENGLIHTFTTKIKPFLKRWDKAPAAATWGGVTFPFTDDFLAMLAHAEMIAVEPLVDSYSVLLRSQPTLVNVDAAERPIVTEVTLHCENGSTTLSNRNYPRNEKFQYMVDKCGETSLVLRFPSFTLTRTYEDFTEFLREFQYGERVFLIDDFPDDASKMNAAGVKDITVRILPDNAASVLQRADNQAPILPDRITYIW